MNKIGLQSIFQQLKPSGILVVRRSAYNEVELHFDISTTAVATYNLGTCVRSLLDYVSGSSVVSFDAGGDTFIVSLDGLQGEDAGLLEKMYNSV